MQVVLHRGFYNNPYRLPVHVRLIFGALVAVLFNEPPRWLLPDRVRRDSKSLTNS